MNLDFKGIFILNQDTTRSGVHPLCALIPGAQLVDLDQLSLAEIDHPVLIIDCPTLLDLPVEGYKWLSTLCRSTELILYLSDSDHVSTTIISKVFSHANFHSVLRESDPATVWTQKLSSSIQRQMEVSKSKALLSDIRRQNEKLETLKGNMEAVVEQRTLHIAGSKKELEDKVAQMRTLLRFLKELSSALSVDEVMVHLRKEIKKYHKVKAPFLGYTNSRLEKKIVSFQGPSVIHHMSKKCWPQSLRIRLNDSEDQRFLANEFGRPFAKLIKIPVMLSKSTGQEGLHYPCLFFEHSMEPYEIEGFLKFIGDRIQPISVALERLVLEQDLKESSQIWENTFESIQDPIAILDIDNHILRSNRNFLDLIEDHEIKLPLSEEQISRICHCFLDSKKTGLPTLGDQKYGGKNFKVHCYPIQWQGKRRPTTFVVHYVDITRSFELQSQMFQTEKMAALGHLAGHIAHELNNPLTGIRSLAQILIAETKDRTQLNEDLLEVEKATKRCQDTIKNLQDFSDGGELRKFASADINEIVKKTLPLLKTATRDFSVNISLTKESTQVFVDSQLVQQVVFNLVNNACQAMESKGVLVVSSSREDKFVVLQIKDNGRGISAKNLELIFDPFYTTKKKGEGTGLGLSMSKKIIERFGGLIRVESQEGEGSTFSILLPHNSLGGVSDELLS